MKTILILMSIPMLATASACSSTRLSSKVEDARSNVNASLERAEAKARPAVRPVAQRLDRGAGEAARKLGLRRTDQK